MDNVKALITKRGLVVTFEKKNEKLAKEYIRKGVYYPPYHNIVTCDYCTFVPICIDDYKEHLLTKHGELHVQKIEKKSKKAR